MSYKAGIVKAISELKDRTGSSSIVIKKHMQANMPKDKKWMNSVFLKLSRTELQLVILCRSRRQTS
jgi:histone H1/5